MYDSEANTPFPKKRKGGSKEKKAGWKSWVSSHIQHLVVSTKCLPHFEEKKRAESAPTNQPHFLRRHQLSSATIS